MATLRPLFFGGIQVAPPVVGGSRLVDLADIVFEVDDVEVIVEANNTVDVELPPSVDVEVPLDVEVD